ncbi:MAG: M28 family peptidase [Gemmatimonadaceae bacterium]
MIHRSLTQATTFALAVLVTGCATARPHVSGLSPADSTAIRSDVLFLASDALEGRGTGTPGNDSAAAWIARRYGKLGLIQPFPGYIQRFDARSAQDAHQGATRSRATQNVVGILRGTDPSLRNQYLVVGAHFDHLGRSSESSLDPGATDAIRNGADDNASGTATVLELARLLAANPPRRSVIFIAFSGEELGLLGSRWFVENPPVPLSSITGMLNFDMVGRLRDDKLIVYGTATATELPELLRTANIGADAPLKVTGIGDGFGPSDHSSFYGKDIPVLHFFTDLHDDYHRATDDADKFNAGGTARVVDLAHRVTRAMADRPARLAFVRSVGPPALTGNRAASQTYLGSIPDMAAGSTPGLRLTGVRAGSPADLGGLRAGDLIVDFGGSPVKDLYTYTDALYAHKPGDAVKIIVLRGSERVQLMITLGKRGG